jgi:catechol 2,3-dioxygenase-like lactoylglutathione lyase family enzyme
MQLTIQTALLNVTDLKQSIAFYQDVLDLRLVSQGDRIAALMIYEQDRRQVLLLRELGRGAYHGGRGVIGLRMLAFEAGSLSELEIIEGRLVDRQALVWQARTDTYRAVIGLDPDRIEISVAASLTGGPIRSQDWNKIDDMIYGIE